MRVLGVLLLSEVFARLAGGRLVVRERGVCSSSALFLSIGTEDACIGEEVGFLHLRDLYVRLIWEDIVVNATVTCWYALYLHMRVCHVSHNLLSCHHQTHRFASVRLIPFVA